MDEAMLKSGQFPNVAIMAGTDPAEVMREHGQVIQNGEKYELADTRKHEPGTRHMDNGVSVQMCPNDTGAHSNVSQNLSDTREQLETDILFEYLEFPGDQNRIFAYLDRQAAITRAECKNTFVHFAERLQLVQNGYDAALRDMQPKVDELTAERDELGEKNSRQRRQLGELQDAIRERNDGVLKRQWQQQVDALTAERDQLKADLKTANDTCNTLRASVAGLKMTVEKRKPDPVEIQAQLARFADEWERADTAIQEQRLIACYAGKLANA
jgi:predicted nuclease with TOPRIM domain